MKTFCLRYCLGLLTVALCFDMARPWLSNAAAPCDPWVAKMVSVQGLVEVRRAGQTQWVTARLNDLYCGGDQIQVGERSRADITLINQPVVRLDQNTTITLGGVKEGRVSLLDLVRGALYFFSRLPRSLEVRTAFVNAGVEGTEGLVIAAADRSIVTIFDGKVLATNQFGSVTLVGGQSALAEQGKAPALTVVVRPRDAVQWALYYPPTIHFRPEEFPPSGPAWQAAVRNSLDAYLKGDLQAAFESIKGVPDTLNEPRFFAYRASLLLAVGRFDEASKDIARVLSLAPNYGDAFALQSIIAVTQNEKDRARELAQKAVTAEPNSASALIALSYAQQANFDLEGALATLQRAVQVSPDNALAWARLAELWLSFGQLNDALDAAKRAVALNPYLSRTQTVLGFAYLTQINTAEARQAFEKAIELDQGDPLPRLGLGLTIIRDGDLQDGRREIEIAVSLDPDNALIRSYLGKAYYEEKRDQQSADEYEISKQLDPKDPTPYFYDAIRKQTTNRPVEALEDMQKAIELNDNRAIYRSRLLLDSDLAARSAAQARIYSDLGFQQLGLVEGWKSVNADPANFSAHRFLADSYAILPRHEIARVSELLQSQLLQPLNSTPIQPRLAEGNLFLISAGGPAALSFNEFNPLFNRNGINFQTSGLAGEDSTYAGEGILSGIYKNASFSIGGFHFQTDGWRRNSDQNDTIANAFVQLELTPQTSVQAEVRRRETEFGDLQQQFFFDQFAPNLRTSIDATTIRVGGRHLISPSSTVIGSLVYQDRDTDQTNPGFVLSRGQSLPQKAFGVEFQHLFRQDIFNVTTGGGYFDVDGKSRGAITSPFISTIPLNFGLNIQHFNLYTYANINILKNLTLTGGLSFDYIDGSRAAVRDGLDRQFNPKVGITWRPFEETSIRLAALRALKRTLITDATLEPTQVAGFNQFFDDLNSTKSWRYGIGIDQKIGRNLFGGMEFSMRNLKIPVINPAPPPITVNGVDAKEYQARNYLFWTPHPWVALRSEYVFERSDNAPPPNRNIKVSTHRVPLGINVFHPSGWSTSLTATYYHQSGTFLRSPFFQSGSDDFWTVDAAINYRLPMRYGFITLGAANLSDNKFKYYDTDRNNPQIQPRRTVFFKTTFAFP